MDLIKRAMELGNYVSFKQVLSSGLKYLKTGSYGYDGTSMIIRNVKNYYDANMALLNRDVYEEIFYQGGNIFTKSKDEPSTQYTKDSNVSDSLVANGCFIEGEVKNSIIFRGVKIGKNAIVKNSILTQEVVIEDNAVVIITHHRELLSNIKADYVHILKDGKIQETGDDSLMDKIEKEGYEWV